MTVTDDVMLVYGHESRVDRLIGSAIVNDVVSTVSPTLTRSSNIRKAGGHTQHIDSTGTITAAITYHHRAITISPSLAHTITAD